jgi:hypothetical protein
VSITWRATSRQGLADIARHIMGCHFFKKRGLKCVSITWRATSRYGLADIARHIMGCHFIKKRGLKSVSITWRATSRHGLADIAPHVIDYHFNSRNEGSKCFARRDGRDGQYLRVPTRSCSTHQCSRSVSAGRPFGRPSGRPSGRPTAVPGPRHPHRCVQLHVETESKLESSYIVCQCQALIQALSSFSTGVNLRHPPLEHPAGRELGGTRQGIPRLRTYGGFGILGEGGSGGTPRQTFG